MKKPGLGKLHGVPKDMREALLSFPKMRTVWETLTPLARNEWICWVISVKKSETRENHLARMREELLLGKRRPCCFAGCPHRR